MSQVTFDEVLQAIENLSADEQAELLDVAHRRLAERGRRRVIDEVAEAKSQFAKGHAKPSSVDEIMREIES